MESSDPLEQAPEPSEAPESVEAEARGRVQGRVAGVIKGGFEVEVGDQTAFCSNAQMDLRRIENPAAYLGQLLEFVVLPPRTDEPEPARMRLSRRRLLLEEERRRQEEQARMDALKDTGSSWGNQMRSYVLHPYQMVKDLRTEHEVGNPTAVLDGDIDGFIEAGIRWRRQQQGASAQ